MGEAKLADCPFDLTGPVVHIWPVVTQVPELVAKELEFVLQPEEKCRADQFRLEHLRRSFIARRAALRVLLRHYLDVGATRIEFSYETRGKPKIAGNATVRFNVSHSGGLALFAFADHSDVGIDVEQIRSLPDMQSIADCHFCSQEAAELLSLPPDQREHAFFLCWTRKEAYIKATGDGLSMPLNEFRMTLRPDEPAALLHLAHDANATKSWALHDLNLDSNYAAALAYQDTPRRLCVFPSVELAQLLALR
jgi:4'-phosphopantetheinyl transferase